MEELLKERLICAKVEGSISGLAYCMFENLPLLVYMLGRRPDQTCCRGPVWGCSLGRRRPAAFLQFCSRCVALGRLRLAGAETLGVLRLRDSSSSPSPPSLLHSPPLAHLRSCFPNQSYQTHQTRLLAHVDYLLLASTSPLSFAPNLDNSWNHLVVRYQRCLGAQPLPSAKRLQPSSPPGASTIALEAR